jgi:hypothetical protein
MLQFPYRLHYFTQTRLVCGSWAYIQAKLQRNVTLPTYSTPLTTYTGKFIPPIRILSGRSKRRWWGGETCSTYGKDKIQRILKSSVFFACYVLSISFQNLLFTVSYLDIKFPCESFERDCLTLHLRSDQTRKKHATSNIHKNKQTPWFQSASELYRPSDRRLSAKLVPNLADRGCRVVSATNPHGR